jgi:flagellar hook assembly protein FlgD
MKKIKSTLFITSIVLIALLFGFNSAVFSQTFGNEWINYNQSYFKIPIFQNGIYRISQADLTAAGISGVNPKNFQIYHRGVEQAIQVQGEDDNSMDANDFIEFYGTANDGSLDRFLYRGGNSWQVNPFYNLFSDTTAFFLTWSLDNRLGKRMAVSDLPTNNTFAPYHWHESLQVFSNHYSIGQNYRKGFPEQIYLSTYDIGEGWVGPRIAQGGRLDHTFTIQNLYTANPTPLAPRLELIMIGDTYLSFTAEVRVGANVNNLRLVTTLSGFSNERPYYSQPLNPSDITANGSFIVRVSATIGNVRVAYIKVSYPQTITMDGQNARFIRLPANNTASSSIEINNPPANAGIYDISDRNNIARINGTLVAGKLRATIGNPANERSLFVSSGTPRPLPKLEPVNFVNVNPQSFDYLIITHPKLRKPAGGYSDIVQAYADYRASDIGGKYKPLVINIDQLYNQFSFGETTPLSIRQFADFMFQRGSPKFIFLIGKGVILPGGDNLLNIRQNPAHFALNLVPTLGFPPSDMTLVAGLGNRGTVEPSIPIGRIGATTPEQIFNYLSKVIEHESEPIALWKKNIAHLSGGRTEDEQVTYRSYVDQFANIARNSCVGVQEINTATKRTTNPVELINISEIVNRGVGLVTFFGHSGLDVTDIEIGLVSDDLQGYRNKGKYPIILANGCKLASIFYQENNRSLSEDWIFSKDRGAIAFIAHSYFGYSNLLRSYSLGFYQLAFGDCNWAGKSIGEVLKENMRRGVQATNVLQVSTYEQMLLQGDPAIAFFPANKVDYYTADNQLYLEPFDNSPVTAVSDSFKLKIIVSNLGIRNNQPLKIKVKRTYSNGTQTELFAPSSFPAILVRDTLTFVIKKDPNINAFGINRFEVTLDYLKEIDELNENNNVGILEYSFPTLGVLPVLPVEYSIVNEQPVVLTGLASSLTNENRPFIFELDTTITFTSPAKISELVPPATSPSWQVNLLTNNNSDSTVYYWRVNSADAVNDPNTLWGQSSFVYIKNSNEGWSQSRFPQFRKSQLTNIQKNEGLLRWSFADNRRQIEVKTFGSTSGTPVSEVIMTLDGLPIVFNSNCNRNGNNNLIAMAFERRTGNPYPVITGNACGREPFVANFYTNTTLNSNGLLNFLSRVREGDYVLFFSIGQINFASWTSAMKSALAQIGGNPLIYNNLANGNPYIIFGTKGGASGSAFEIVAGNITNPSAEAIQMTAPIKLEVSNGEILSSRIGPAKKWKELVKNIITAPEDDYILDLYGVSALGVVTNQPIISNIKANNTNLSAIDANIYPYLALKLKVIDASKYTPAQLKKWLVLYDGVPEGFIDPDAIGLSAYVIPKKTEGETFKLDFAFRNITNISYPVDSLAVRYTITNQETLSQKVITTKIKSPLPKELIRFSINVPTIGLGGNNELKVFVNPPDQNIQEVLYENNIFLVNFEVQKDNSNPILEVAFDGRKIMDGEIVAPSPLVSVNLRDNNPYFTPQDPNSLSLALKKPCDTCPFEEVSLNNPTVTWSADPGLLKVNLRLQDLENGKYTLRAQGFDSFGNKAGSEPYEISFEVVRESSVTNVFPYPNPFSSSTRFVFDLTGSEIPDEVKIQIMTVSGKVIREITQAELGPLRIGNNLTEYAWNGTDEFGDKLANGVYLYRVIMRRNGQTLENRATSADKAFKNGIGKLYIAR